MTLAGLTLPDLSAWDPPVSGEGSLDPMGLAAISDRLADRLVPGMRARMLRFRFLTAMAVGAMACESLVDDISAAGTSTPSICFEWLVLEAFVRRRPHDIPYGFPGSQKAAVVYKRGERLSAHTYLKGPSVFGFNGVYKPFAVDSGLTGHDLEPGVRCAELVRAWEHERGYAGFTDAIRDTEGERLRRRIRNEVRDALHEGRCTTNSGSWLFGQLARSLHPDEAGQREKRVLRTLVTQSVHETRAELARIVDTIDPELSEADVLDAARPACSEPLRRIVDAVIAYEQFALLVDTAFRTLCFVSHAIGTQPLTASIVANNDVIAACAAQLAARYQAAAECMNAIDAAGGLEERLGEFAISRSPRELFDLLIEHHQRVQAGKPPNGKRPWFEPLRDGWVVRTPYATSEPSTLDRGFVHPVRVAALARFLEDTRA